LANTAPVSSSTVLWPAQVHRKTESPRFIEFAFGVAPFQSARGMENKHVVVLGAGFGGLTFCQTLNHPRARVTLVDRQNHHLFQPLLYQVATAGLSAPEIAQPIRSILSDQPNVTVLLDLAVDFDLTG